MEPGDNEIVVKRMTEEQFREFVDGFVDGRIFTAAHLAPEKRALLIPTVFLPLSTGLVSKLPDEVTAQIGMVWEWADRSVEPSDLADWIQSMRQKYGGSDLPCFFSVRVMHAADWELAVEAIRLEQERRRVPSAVKA